MEKVKNLILLLRPHHYVKNILIFAPVFFALRITEVDLVVRCILASIIFSLIAGVVYIINDYKDIEEDKLHPIKKHRPLASGKVTKQEAILLGTFTFIAAVTSSYLLDVKFLGLIIIYFIMNLAYSFKLKQMAIVDIFILSLGFIIRLLVGSAVTGIMLTDWIIILVFLLAMFLGFAKRRDDLILFEQTGKQMRKSMNGYNETFLNAAVVMTSTIIIVAYIMYTTSLEIITKFRSQNLYITSIFVLFGVLRYLQLTFVETKSGSPVQVLVKDRAIQLTVVLWLIAFGLLIYF